MLIAATLTFLFLYFHSDSSSPTLLWPYEQTEKLIKADVSQAHQAQALAIVAQMRAVNKAYVVQREKSVAALAKLEAVRTTPSESIVRASQPLIDEDRAAAEQLLDLRLELKTVLTASEWAKVFPAPAATPGPAKNKS